MNIAQEFINAETIDADFIKHLIDTYGAKKIDQFLERHLTIFTIQSELSRNDRLEVLKKVRDFIHLYKNNTNSINYDRLLEPTSKRSNKGSDKPSSLEPYIQKIREYPLLTAKEEIQVGWDLLLKDQISIMMDSKSKMLNMSMVLLSISSEKERKKVFGLLEKFYQGKNFIDRDETKLVKQDMKTYNSLCKKLGRIPAPRELKEYFDISQTSKQLPFNELIDQLQKYITYRKARMTMFNCNLRLVLKIANQYANSNNIDDLIAEGNYALLGAIDRYDVTFGTRFSTYATYRIRQYIIRYIQQDRAPRIPENKIAKMYQLKRKLKELKVKQEKVSTTKLLEVMGMSYNEIISLLASRQASISLDTPIFEGENITLLDTIVGEDDIITPLEKEEQKQEIMKLLSYLSPRYQEIMSKRFGFTTENGEPMTLAAIGEEYGVTKERIRQIENTSLKKLRLIVGLPEEENIESRQLKK